MPAVDLQNTTEATDKRSIAWRGFLEGRWMQDIDVRDFIQRNYKPYKGDESFLAGPTQRTSELMDRLNSLQREELAKGGVLDIDTKHISSLLTYEPGYLDKEKELIVGLQTDAPLKRSINPFGGMRMARAACKAYGYEVDKSIEDVFEFRSTHNDGVYRAYTEEIRKARKSGVITGLPDAYGRGRIIGDYRRVALYGMDYLIKRKIEDRKQLGQQAMTNENIQLIEEIAKQINFLKMLLDMGKLYGFDISVPATTAREAIQWVYFAYLGAIKEQNGAAMSLGRVSTFLDIYIQRDIEEGVIDEVGAQELIDDFVMKLRMARHLRTPDYNDLFAGDPLWITESVGGIGEDGRPLVTKSSYRILNTLYTLGHSPEPNLTILWSARLPEPFKRYCAKISIETASVQYENDDVMRPVFGDDYGIACCVSAMKIGKQMQFFGARCNLPKALLMALNGGKDELTGEQIGPEMLAVQTSGPLDYQDVLNRFAYYRNWLCRLYVNTMNIIHYMHDRYAYEKLQMGLHDTQVQRFMAFGIAGLSVIADSFSAIRYAKVTPVRNEQGLITEFEIEGDFPKFGNDDDRVDAIARTQVEDFTNTLRQTPAYRGAEHTLSILTITSNVVYGKKTGSTPDGRKYGEPFAPGANPMHNRDTHGALASLNSVAKLPYHACRDGISCTFSITPQTLGAELPMQQANLVSILNGYFAQSGHHLNVNVINREKLVDAMENPEKYPHLTIRVSGYAVNFNRLTRVQQEEVIARTFHDRI